MTRVLGVGFATFALFYGARTAVAGEGQILVDKDPAGKFVQGRIQPKIFVDLPRTADEYTKMIEQLKGANRLICDYTDGLFRLDSVQFVTHPAEKQKADIWWFERSDRAFADGGAFGRGANLSCDGTDPANPSKARAHLTIYAIERADTIAHELGHLVFGLGDFYPDDRMQDGWYRATAIDGPLQVVEPQSNLSFFRSPRNGAIFREFVLPGPLPTKPSGVGLYDGPPGVPWYLTNNSIMQQSSSQVCRDANGMSAFQLNPALWVDGTSCISATDANGDGVSDDCAAFVNGFQCTAGKIGSGCSASPKIGADPTCDSTPGAHDGVCSATGFPFCTPGTINTSSELSTPKNIELNRYDAFDGDPIASGDGNGHIQPAGQLVIQGFPFPSTVGQPAVGSAGDSPCADRKTGTTPAGTCNHACDVATDEGNQDWEFQCSNPGRIGSSPCPFSDLATSPNHSTPADVQCDGCVVANSSLCTAMFPPAPAVGGACGNGTVDIELDATNNPQRVEECDNGNATTNTVDTTVPVIDPNTGQPLRCADLFSPWKVKRGDARATTGPKQRFSGGVVFCQKNCFFDLSRCSEPLLSDLDPGTDAVLVLKEARDQSTTPLAAEAFDANGQVSKDVADFTLSPVVGFPDGRLNIDKIGPSDHGVFVFMRRMLRFRVNGPSGAAWPTPSVYADHVYHEVWELILAMDQSEFSGAAVGGKMLELRRFELEFEPDYIGNKSKLVSINGHSCSTVGTRCVGDDPNEWPMVFIGFAANPAGDAYVGTGPCFLQDGKCSVAQAATGPFARVGQNSAQTLSLRLDLRNLQVRTVTDSNGGTFNAGLVNMYARNSLKNVGGQIHEVPQYSSVAVRLNGGTDIRFRDLFNFNTTTQRYEGAEGTMRLVGRQLFGDLANPGYDAVPFPKDAAELQAREASLLAIDPVTHVQHADQFIDSDWQTASKVMCRRWGIAIPPDKIPQSGVQIKADLDPASCPDLPAPATPPPVKFNEDTQIVFVLDHSGSMGTVQGQDTNKPNSRLDYVKDSARSFLRDVLAQAKRDDPTNANPFGPKVGLVWFSDDPEVKIPELGTKACTTATAAVDCPDSQSCIKGTCALPMRPIATTGGNDPTQPIGLDVVDGDLRMKGEGAAENPTAGGPRGGFTATGDAMLQATQLFNPGRTDPATGKPLDPTKIIVLLSDGLHNRPSGGVCLGPQFCTQRDGSNCLVGTCGSSGKDPCSDADHGNEAGCWPTSEADKLFSQALDQATAKNILLFDIPLANESDKAGAAIRAGQVGGEVFEATRNFGEDGVPVFMQTYAATHGEQLARTHQTLPYLETVRQVEIDISHVVYEIPVEQGARALEVRVSDYDALADDFSLDGLILVGPPPTSASYTLATAASDTDPLSATMRVGSPAAGTWKLYDSASAAKGHLLYYVAARVENPSPNCFVEASAHRTDGSKPMIISAQAFYERPLVSGVTFTGTLLRPDRLLADLTFTVDANGTARAVVPPEQLVGRGNYVANVRCDVAATAQVDPGERPVGADPAPAQPIQPVAFHREVATTFFYDTKTQPPVPGLNGNQQDPGVLNKFTTGVNCQGTCTVPISFAPVTPYVGDADGDGIKNSDEPPPDVDTDGDGIPDVNDPDANGNEKPDKGDTQLPPKQIWPMFGRTVTRQHQTDRFRGPTANGRKFVFTTPSGDISSSPAIGSDGTAYFGSDDAYVYAVRRDGAMLWRTKTGGNVDSSPAIGLGGVVFVGSDDDNLYALNGATGAVICKRNLGSRDVDSSPAIAPDGTVLVGSDDDNFYALNPTDCSVKWTVATGGDINSSAAIDSNGDIYFGSDDNKVYARHRDGSPKWTVATGGNVKSTPALSSDGKALYVGSNDDNVWALNTTTGATLWKAKLLGDIECSPAVGSDGTIYVGSVLGFMYALNPANGAVKWSKLLAPEIRSSPAVDASGTVYVGADEPVFALNGATGAVIWQFKTGGDVRSSPAIGIDGSLVIGSDDNKLYAFGPGQTLGYRTEGVAEPPLPKVVANSAEENGCSCTLATKTQWPSAWLLAAGALGLGRIRRRKARCVGDRAR
jgi:outer membrane protein assembly factor BamB